MNRKPKMTWQLACRIIALTAMMAPVQFCHSQLSHDYIGSSFNSVLTDIRNNANTYEVVHYDDSSVAIYAYFPGPVNTLYSFNAENTCIFGKEFWPYEILVEESPNFNTMQILDLNLDHDNFYCPATGIQIVGDDFPCNEDAPSLMGYWIDQALDMPYFNNMDLEKAWESFCRDHEKKNDGPYPDPSDLDENMN